MRFLVIIATLICVSSSPAFCKSDTSFDEFIKSREVVTTLYFQSNAEDLSHSERERLSAAIDQLRGLQKNGRMIRVEGFSSPEGDQETNFKLSFFRARSVAVLIEAKGLPAEVALTGYGDLRAKSDDPNVERRVEIASYLQPVGMKRVKFANQNNNPAQIPGLNPSQVSPQKQDIDSYSVDQAIRRKIDEKNKGLADKNKVLGEGISPRLSQSKEQTDFSDLDRGYSQWRKAVDPESLPKLSQLIEPVGDGSKHTYTLPIRAVDTGITHGYSQAIQPADSDLKRGYSKAQDAADSDLKRGYSKAQEAADSDLKRGYSRVAPEKSPGLTQVTPTGAPFIDALMIEQAIMEKIGAELPAPSGAVSQLDVNY